MFSSLLIDSYRTHTVFWQCLSTRSVPKPRVLVVCAAIIVVVVVVVVVLTLTRIIKSVVTGQALVTLELRNTPGKNTNQRWYTHISALTQSMPPPETYKSEFGSQSTMCQVRTGAYVSLLAPGKTGYTACHPRKTTVHPADLVSRRFRGRGCYMRLSLGKLLVNLLQVAEWTTNVNNTPLIP